MDILLFTLTTAVLVACAAAFLLLLAYKWDIVEWMQVHGDFFISRMAQCDFCMCFWLSVIMTLIMVAATNNAALLIIPIISTPIARRLL